MTRRNSRGFSMVELLIVMAIVGMVIGAAFFMYRSQSKRSETDEKFMRVQTLITELERFKNDHDGRYPTGTCGPSSCTWASNSSLASSYLSDYYWNEGWSYSCSAGGNPTITITYIPTDEVGAVLVGRLNSALASQGGTCTYDAGTKTITCTLQGRRCA